MNSTGAMYYKCRERAQCTPSVGNSQPTHETSSEGIFNLKFFNYIRKQQQHNQHQQQQRLAQQHQLQKHRALMVE
jgi:hypothetical protein